MVSDALNITIGRFKHKIFTQFCCSPLKQENDINMVMNSMENGQFL